MIAFCSRNSRDSVATRRRSLTRRYNAAVIEHNRLEQAPTRSWQPEVLQDEVQKRIGIVGMCHQSRNVFERRILLAIAIFDEADVELVPRERGWLGIVHDPESIDHTDIEAITERARRLSAVLGEIKKLAAPILGLVAGCSRAGRRSDRKRPQAKPQAGLYA